MRISRHSRRQTDQRRRGSALIEFTLVGSFVFLPMLAGLATVGMSMVMGMQVASLNANAGQMFASGVDFTQATNVALLLQTAGSLAAGPNGITASGGNGVIILSEIAGSDGTSAGEVCPLQIIIGNQSLFTSNYVPGGQGGTVSSAFTSMMPNLALGQVSYLAEAYFNNSQYAWAFAPGGTGMGIYVKAIY